jgi:hypothetical protein
MAAVANNGLIMLAGSVSKAGFGKVKVGCLLITMQAPRAFTTVIAGATMTQPA